MILLLQQEISHGLQLQHMMVLVLWYFYQVPQISFAQTVDKQYICISYEEKKHQLDITKYFTDTINNFK